MTAPEPKKTMIARMPLSQSFRAATLRTNENILSCIREDLLWLRFDGDEDEGWRLLAPIAEGPLLLCDDQNRLTPIGKHVPAERLPELNWQKPSEVLAVSLPVSRMMHFSIPRIQLTLVRSETERPASLLTTSWEAFERWAVDAPELRLKCCRFGILKQVDSTTECRVAITGVPLPPLSGERFWMDDNIAVPLGLSWKPAVDTQTLRSTFERNLDVEPSDPGLQDLLWIWHPDNGLNFLCASDFVPALRTNIRSTRAGLRAGSD